jgi:hypothetical protein
MTVSISNVKSCHCLRNRRLIRLRLIKGLMYVGTLKILQFKFLNAFKYFVLFKCSEFSIFVLV